jgi:hypothetical protein
MRHTKALYRGGGGGKRKRGGYHGRREGHAIVESVAGAAGDREKEEGGQHHRTSLHAVFFLGLCVVHAACVVFVSLPPRPPTFVVPSVHATFRWDGRFSAAFRAYFSNEQCAPKKQKERQLPITTKAPAMMAAAAGNAEQSGGHNIFMRGREDAHPLVLEWCPFPATTTFFFFFCF